MPTGVWINMKNNNALISVAMLTTFLNNKKDYLDMISPFVYSTLSLSVGEKVNVQIIQDKMGKEYGFEDIPIKVINKILSRACKGEDAFLKKEKGEFSLIKTFNNKKFNDNRNRMKTLIDNVINAFEENLKASIDNQKYDAREMFTTFLETYGYSARANVEGLKALTITKDRKNYYVARFILDEYVKKSTIFEDILEIIKGFFIYKSLYLFNTEQKKDVQSKLKNTVIYLDTKLLIYALGYNREEDRDAINEMISLVMENGGCVKAFSQHKDEVAKALTKYAKDPLSRNGLSLEYFRKNNYDEISIMRLRDSINNDLEKIGIIVEDKLEYGNVDDKQNFDNSFLDLEELSQQLSQKVKYNKFTSLIALENDVNAISAISRLRGKSHMCGIENCKAILVTTNISLIRALYELYEERFKHGEVNFAISDIDLTSILWLKSYDKTSSLPKLKLLEAAYAACEPTPELLSVFDDKIEMLKNEDKIDEESALLLRTENYAKDELTKLSQNDPSLLTNEVVINIKNSFEKSLIVREQKEIDSLKQKLNEEEERKFRKAKERADNARLKKERFYKGLTNLAFIILLAIVLIANFWIYKNDIFNDWCSLVAAIVLVVVCIISWVDFLRKPTNKIKEKIDKKVQNIWDEVYAKELDDLQN